MPTVLRSGPYRFFSYANDREEPAHAPTRLTSTVGYESHQRPGVRNSAEKVGPPNCLDLEELVQKVDPFEGPRRHLLAPILQLQAGGGLRKTKRGTWNLKGRERVTLRAMRVCILTLACAAVACTLSSVSTASDAAEAAAQVRAALAAWPQDFAAKRTAEVCALFAPDAVLSYPGTKDRDFDALCAHFRDLFAIRDKSFTYAVPQIEEVIVDGDTVVVRLVWTLTVADSTGKTLEVVKEKGVDVFRRQPNGSWKIRISHAYPEGTHAPAPR
jgi:ketosteroid isomerase-like protein